jgi:hypothetical protein
MPPLLFDTLTPRPEVREGALSDAIFAASLDDVVAEAGPDVYREPAAFFAATHPSDGLRSLLNEALGRVGAGRPDASPVIRLETNLGGGKTHNLIALYHAARGALTADIAAEFMDPALRLASPVEQLGVFVGTAVGATAFPEVEGVTPQTVWGYLALQLGGAAAYEHVRSDDEARTAPGANDLRKVFAGRPSLVLLDELARYLRTAQGVTVGGTTLDQQVTAFLMALMEAADREAHTTVVITMTETTDPFGGMTEAVVHTIDEARSLMARRERVLRPSGEADLPHILARRLFENADVSAVAAEVGQYCAEGAQAFAGAGIELPDDVTGAGWASEVAASYPFHPELIRVLDKRVSTIPNFQRTRGALRLLARTVRSLWDHRPNDAMLVYLHHVDLADRDIAEDLSSRLDRPKWEPVIRADVASSGGGELAHAERIDERLGGNVARRLATAVYLFSLTQDVPGVPAPELLASVLVPGEDGNLALKALDALEKEAWYLHTDTRGFRFSTEIALPKLILDAQNEISTSKTKQAATDILARQFRDAALKVRRTWEDAKVPDRSDDAYLVLLHWDELQLDGPDPVPSRIADLWENGPAGGPREFRNRLVFLAPAKHNHEAMLRTVRRHLALHRLIASPERVAALSDDKRIELKQLAQQSELEARIAVCNHVNLLFVPVVGGLEGHELDLVTQASLKPNQTEAILDRLAVMEKTLTAGSKALDPRMIRSRLGKLLENPLPTSGLLDQFARRSDLKLVLDRKQIVDLIVAGVRNGVWEYQDPELGDDGWGTAERPAKTVRLDTQTLLHPPGSAPAPSAVACPLCGTVHTGPCPTGPGPGPGPEPAADDRASFAASGSAPVALAAVRQQAGEAERKELRLLRVHISEIGDGTAQQLARLLTMAPKRPGATIRYEITLSAVLSDVQDVLKLEFRGSAADYEPVRSSVDQVLRQRQATLEAAIDVSFDPPLELAGDEVEQLRASAGDTGPAKCDITIYTEQSA